MSVFFDAGWFDARLEERGLNRSSLAAAAGLPMEALSELMKDQREIDPQQVLAFAALLGVDPAEIARRCGVTTRPPRLERDRDARLSELERRVAALEAALDRLQAR